VAVHSTQLIDATMTLLVTTSWHDNNSKRCPIEQLSAAFRRVQLLTDDNIFTMTDDNW
jgi:hypothetical protein